MICIPAELEIDEKSIIAQMDCVKEAQWVFEDEMNKLRQLLMSTRVKEVKDEEREFNCTSRKMA